MSRLIWITFIFLLPALESADHPRCAASVEAVITRARATIGSEQALGELVTLKIEGRVESARPMQPEGNVRMILRRPNEYRSSVRIEDMAEDTIVRAGKGCMVWSSPALEHSQLRPLSEEEVHRINATIQDIFQRFRIDPQAGGTIRHLGIVDRRGTRCHHLRYTYPGGVTVDRFFAACDGQLVCVVNDLGVEYVPIGSIEIGGLIFPEKVEYYENREKLHSIIFTRIEVNKPLPAGIFSVPR